MIEGDGSYAAKLCYDLVLNGYSDWYLPSKDVLNKLFINRAAIGGFANQSYWSSSEYNSTNTWWRCFDNTGWSCGHESSQWNADKISTLNIRAVRSF
jgi:hypothetical protein